MASCMGASSTSFSCTTTRSDSALSLAITKINYLKWMGAITHHHHLFSTDNSIITCVWPGRCSIVHNWKTTGNWVMIMQANSKSWQYSWIISLSSAYDTGAGASGMKTNKQQTSGYGSAFSAHKVGCLGKRLILGKTFQQFNLCWVELGRVGPNWV